MRVKIFYIFCVSILSYCINAQELLPFVENFTKSEYNGDNQMWSVSQGSDNAMYFANNHYLLRYNGIKWERYSLPNKTIIRSVFSDGGKVYCGSYKEFGYWQRIRGQMKYFTLSGGKKLFEGNADNEEIWKIFKHGKKLYFQSFNQLYIKDGDKVTNLKFPSQVSYCYSVGNEIYVATVREGMFILRGNTFSQVKTWPELKNTIVHGIASNKASLYVFTKNSGVFTGTVHALKPWPHPLNDILKNDVVLTAKFVGENTLAIGTALQGLYVVNLANGSYKNLNRKNVLKNNAVLTVGTDAENDLWLGLDNGIAHVEINSPIRIASDNSGALGSVYALSPFSGGYLLASNHGVFNYNDKQLLTVPGSQGQVWDIYRHNDGYVIGHNDGTYSYRNGRFIKENSITGGWKLIKSNFDDAYFQAHYAGISVYRDISNLADHMPLAGITKPVKNIAQNKAGELWAADNYRGLYRITYNKDFKVKKVENISSSNGISNDFGVKIFDFRNQIFFYIDNSWYIYNSISKKLEKHALFNKHFKGITDAIPVTEDSFIMIKNNLLHLVTFEGESISTRILPEKYYQGKLILENTRTYEESGQLLINLDDGFLAFSAGRDKRLEQDVIVEAFYLGRPVDGKSNIENNQTIELNVISKYFGFNRPDLFYKFKHSKEFIPIKQGVILLNNLSSGTQNIEIYTQYGPGFKKIAMYQFHVLRPWYFSWGMILIYIFVISGIFFLYYRWNKIRYAGRIKLHEEELKHQRDIMELEMTAENRLRQQAHEKQMLEMEVQAKASEVAGKSLSIAKHSEMIESIQEVLETDANADQLRTQVRKIIKTSAISKNEWQSFEKNLIKSHEEFVDRLVRKYPALTSKDIKLCIYLKMNLSSKEIAPLMNISFRGVELHRYRLRKKVGIAQEVSLSKFITTV